MAPTSKPSQAPVQAPLRSTWRIGGCEAVDVASASHQAAVPGWLLGELRMLTVIIEDPKLSTSAETDHLNVR